jgi:hypothetical protein
MIIGRRGRVNENIVDMLKGRPSIRDKLGEFS